MASTFLLTHLHSCVGNSDFATHTAELVVCIRSADGCANFPLVTKSVAVYIYIYIHTDRSAHWIAARENIRTEL